MFYTFSGCSSLTELASSHFNTQNVTNTIGMFSGCEKLNQEIIDKIKQNN